MANINIKNISELNLNGNDLFEDSESFITELDNCNEKDLIIGGCPNPPPGEICCASCLIGTIYDY